MPDWWREQEVGRSERSGGGYWWFLATTALVVAAVLVNALVAYGNEEGRFSPGIARFFNTFAYFTILSNILTGAMSLLLARGVDARAIWFRVLRITALIAITITGLVYHTLLRQEWDPEGWALVGDQLAHTVVPLMALLGFVLFGPRGLIDIRDVWLGLLFPVVWSIFTMFRGEVVDWYPYPFIDVGDHGYGRVFINMAGIAIVFWSVGTAYRLADDWLATRHGVRTEATV
jgi:hypothetical protein